MNNSKELIAFKNDFEKSTGINVLFTIEERTYFHWKRLVLPHLNSEHLLSIAIYINNRFYTKNKYTHLSPKIQSYENNLVLTVDVKDIKKFILNEK